MALLGGGDDSYQVRPGDGQPVRDGVGKALAHGGGRGHRHAGHAGLALNIRPENVPELGSVLGPAPPLHPLHRHPLRADDDHGRDGHRAPVPHPHLHHVDPVDGEEAPLLAHVQDDLLTYGILTLLLEYQSYVLSFRFVNKQVLEIKLSGTWDDSCCQESC